MKIKKTSGEIPLKINTSAGSVEFDEKGIAEVDDDLGELLLTIPGYVEVKTRNKPDPDKVAGTEDKLPPESNPNTIAPKEDENEADDAAADNKKADDDNKKNDKSSEPAEDTKKTTTKAK